MKLQYNEFNMVARAVCLLTCFREIPNSNLGLDIHFPEGVTFGLLHPHPGEGRLAPWKRSRQLSLPSPRYYRRRPSVYKIHRQITTAIDEVPLDHARSTCIHTFHGAFSKQTTFLSALYRMSWMDWSLSLFLVAPRNGIPPRESHISCPINRQHFQ
jgi:hypothetical protein